MPQKLSIIIPSYNEEKTIIALLDKVIRVCLINDMQKELIIIDDGSKDATSQIVTEYMQNHPHETIKLISHNINQGKGMAIRTGIENVTGDFIIIQDADLEYEPEDYNLLLPVLITRHDLVVYGSRFLMKENKHSYISFYLGGLFVTAVTNILYGQRLTDEPTCYKAFDSKLLKSIPLKCTGFEFCPEVTAKVAKRGIIIKEIPIRYYPRSICEGEKIRWTDGLFAIWTLLKYRFTN